MANLRINTDAVAVAAANISKINNQIRDGFSDVQSAISKLNASWEGSAATHTISKFSELKANYCDERYKELDTFVQFLLHQIGEGYEDTENVNVSLADVFK